MLSKLRLLTIVTHASQHKILPYDLLLKELDLANVRELEDIIIDCVYQGLVKGKLDQKKSAFEVHSTIGRDISPADIDAILKKLSMWSDASEVLVSQLEKKIVMANDNKVQEKKDEEDLAKEKKDVIEALKIQKEQEAAQGAAAMMGGGPMGALMSNMAGMMGFGDGGDRRSGKRRPNPRGLGGMFGGAGGR